MGAISSDANNCFGGESPRILADGPSGLFLYKPPGMSVFESRQHPERACLLHFLQEYRAQSEQIPWPQGFEGGILHRLDVSTSGIIWVAKSLAAFHQSRAAFEGRVLKKTYYFLSAEAVDWSFHDEVRSIAHHRKNRRKMVVQMGPRSAHRGKWIPARTQFRHLGALPEADIHLYAAVMSSGVMHQIRVHAKAAGCPLLGDVLYGGAPAEGPNGAADFYLHHADLRWGARHLCSAEAPKLWPRLGPELSAKLKGVGA